MPDLLLLAETVAAWADAHPHVERIHIFGSRVRGDHRSDSDLDVLVQPPQGGISGECLDWWRRPEEERFTSLREAVHPIELHPAPWHDSRARRLVTDASLDATRVMLRVRKVVCVSTSPKPKQCDDVVT